MSDIPLERNRLTSIIENSFRALPGLQQSVPVYKFVSRKYMDAFFETGSVRIGTMHGFRDTIAHGTSRSDIDEGNHAVVRQVDDLVLTGGYEPMISDFIGMPPSGSGATVRFTNCNFIRRHSFPNSYIFCTAAYFSEDAFLRWNESEGIDACYEINDYAVFRNAISKELAGSARWYADRYCNYVGTEIQYDSPFASEPPVFTKRKHYEWQAEQRGVWLPIGPVNQFDAKVIQIPSAIRTCRPVAILERGTVKYL
jgi:hypothetical protein